VSTAPTVADCSFNDDAQAALLDSDCTYLGSGGTSQAPAEVARGTAWADARACRCSADKGEHHCDMRVSRRRKRLHRLRAGHGLRRQRHGAAGAVSQGAAASQAWHATQRTLTPFALFCFLATGVLLPRWGRRACLRRGRIRPRLELHRLHPLPRGTL
jgi:hypothetical protein